MINDGKNNNNKDYDDVCLRQQGEVFDDDNDVDDNAVDDNAVDDVAAHPADVEPALSSADISQNKLLAGGVGYQHLVIKVVISTWLSKPLQ